MNIAISPDGRTILVPKVFNASTEGYIYAFQAASPGVLVPGNPPFVAGMPTGEQSVAYSSTEARPMSFRTMARITTPSPC